MYRLWCNGVVSPPGGFESAPLFRPGCLGHWCLCYHYCLSHCYPSPCCCYCYFSLVSLPADWGLKDNMKYSFRKASFFAKTMHQSKDKRLYLGKTKRAVVGSTRWYPAVAGMSTVTVDYTDTAVFYTRHFF